MQELDSVRINFDNNQLWLLNIALGIVMFGVALDISLRDFKLLLKSPKQVLIGVLCQFVLMPLLTLILVYLFKPQPSIALGMFMVAACPGGNVSNFMSHLAKGNAALSISLTALATFLAMFMTPFNFQFYSNLYEPTSQILKSVSLDSYELVKLVILLLGVPLTLGMFIRYKNEKVASLISEKLKPLSILIFGAIVFLAILKNKDVFYDYFHHVVAIGISHNIAALLLGFYVAKLFGLSFENQKTLAIETGIQNAGLGLLLIFSFFIDFGGMAILVAFWGIWHLISGLVLALFWSKYRN